MKKIQIISMMLSGLSILAGCQKSELSTAPISDDPINDLLMGKLAIGDFVSADKFVDEITNPYFELNIGDTLYYELTAFEDGDSIFEESYVAVTNEVKIIEGINCTVVHDVVFDDGEIVEDTYDWYAQDKFGNVWYLGEDTKKYYEDGTYTTEGSFEHGVDGAEGGLQMLADPGAHIGHIYQQENYAGFAEDAAKVISVDAIITIGLGTYTGCILIAETSPLAPGILGYKYYYPGLGQVFSITTIGDPEQQELVDTNF